MNLGGIFMDLVYKPRACQEAEAKVTGQLTIRVPSVVQKYDYMDKCGIEVGIDGQVDMAKMNTIRFIKTLIELSEDHYVAIDLKKVNGATVTTWDELIHDPDCEPVVNEVATALISGFRPSGN